MDYRNFPGHSMCCRCESCDNANRNRHTYFPGDPGTPRPERFHVQDFDWHLADALVQRLSKHDLDDLALNGLTPHGAIIWGNHFGPTYLAMDGAEPIGVFGATRQGVIWGFFATLTLPQSKAVLRLTPRWVRQLLRETGRPVLVNRAFSSRPHLKWLGRVGCFEIVPGANVGAAYTGFRTKEAVVHV